MSNLIVGVTEEQQDDTGAMTEWEHLFGIVEGMVTAVFLDIPYEVTADVVASNVTRAVLAAGYTRVAPDAVVVSRESALHLRNMVSVEGAKALKAGRVEYVDNHLRPLEQELDKALAATQEQGQ